MSFEQVEGAGSLLPSDFIQFLRGGRPVVAPLRQLEDYLESLASGPVYNVTSFGAVGDGVTDDTLAIQRALNAAGEAGVSTVVFPKGDFFVTPQTTVGVYTPCLRIPNNVKVRGDRWLTHVFCPQDVFPDESGTEADYYKTVIFDNIDQTTGRNITVSDMRISGPRNDGFVDITGYNRVNGLRAPPSWMQDGCIRFNGVDGALVERVHIMRTKRSAIVFSGTCKNVTVQYCKGTSAVAGTVQGSYRAMVSSNAINTKVLFNDSFDSGSFHTIIQAPGDHSMIAGNYCENSRDIDYAMEIMSVGQIVYNTSKNCQNNAINVERFTGNNDFFIIHGNMITGCAGEGGFGAIRILNCRRVIVSGNNISGSRSTGIRGCAGSIHLINVSDSLIDGNISDREQLAGVVGRGVRRCTFIGNHIIDPVQRQLAYEAGSVSSRPTYRSGIAFGGRFSSYATGSANVSTTENSFRLSSTDSTNVRDVETGETATLTTTGTLPSPLTTSTVYYLSVLNDEVGNLRVGFATSEDNAYADPPILIDLTTQGTGTHTTTLNRRSTDNTFTGNTIYNTEVPLAYTFGNGGISANTITISGGHAFANGAFISLRSSDSILPSGIESALPRLVGYVINATATTFQIAATSGGAAISFTGDGSGLFYVSSATVPMLFGFTNSDSGGDVDNKFTGNTVRNARYQSYLLFGSQYYFGEVAHGIQTYVESGIPRLRFPSLARIENIGRLDLVSGQSTLDIISGTGGACSIRLLDSAGNAAGYLRGGSNDQFGLQGKTQLDIIKSDLGDGYTRIYDAAGNQRMEANLNGTTFSGPLALAKGANAKHGTVTLNGATPVSVANTSITADSGIIFTLKTVGGTVGAHPAIQTITPGTGFTVAGTSGDTSVYNYHVLEAL